MGKLGQWLIGVMGGYILPSAAWAQAGVSDWGWERHPMWWMWSAWGIGMMLVMLAFWALVIVGIVLGIRWLVGTGRSPASDRAIEILRERYVTALVKS